MYLTSNFIIIYFSNKSINTDYILATQSILSLLSAKKCPEIWQNCMNAKTALILSRLWLLAKFVLEIICSFAELKHFKVRPRVECTNPDRSTTSHPFRRPVTMNSHPTFCGFGSNTFSNNFSIITYSTYSVIYLYILNSISLEHAFAMAYSTYLVHRNSQIRRRTVQCRR